MGTKRRKIRHTRSERYAKGKSLKVPIWVLAVVVVLLVIIVIFIGRYAFLFITESSIDPNNPYPVKGIDVSVYQLDIDWEGLKDEDIAFAFIKATEGASHVDSNFKTNWEESRKAGIATGAYHFLSFDSKADKQADNFIKNVPKKWKSLPPVVDVEMYGDYSSTPPSAKVLREKLDIILNRFEERYHKTPIIYTNGYLYSKYIKGHYDDYPIWISDPEVSSQLSDGKKWTFCQYTFTGHSKHVAGGEKYVDFNYFNGSKWDFRKFK